MCGVFKKRQKNRRRSNLPLAVLRQHGFTLVELLVVIAIIGVLIAMLLPAVQAAREAARRLQCQGNLKQLGLALCNFTEQNKAYPIGVRGGEQGYGWGHALLPFLEQQSLYDLLNESITKTNMPPETQTETIFEDTYNSTGKIIPGGDEELRVFRCPSSGLESHGVEMSFYDYQNGYATSDYKGCTGNGDSGIFFNVYDGLLLDPPMKRVRVVDVVDGLSNTIALGESSYYYGAIIGTQPGGGSRPEDKWGTLTWPIWLGAHGRDESTLFKTDDNAYLNCQICSKSLEGFKPQMDGSGPMDDDCAFSWHANGAFFVFADGSVHFLEEKVDIETYKSLGTRNDGGIPEPL